MTQDLDPVDAKQTLKNEESWAPSIPVFEGEAELVAALEEGGELAFRTVIEAHGGVIFGMAWRILQDATLAEEIAQDAIVALWAKPGVFDPSRGNLQSFLVRITRNKAIDRVRQVEARPENPVPDEQLDAKEEPMTGVARHLEETERVRSALNKLSPIQREALVLVYFGGRTCKEMAHELDIPEGTAKTRLRDALLKLRELKDEI
jgi:RNA polymerase sigma-70 factor (ECF subfamily)